jgi:hypothetical protein
VQLWEWVSSYDKLDGFLGVASYVRLRLGDGGGLYVAPRFAATPTTALAASAPVHLNIERLLACLSVVCVFFSSDIFIIPDFLF